MHRYKNKRYKNKVNSEWIAIANVQLIGTSLIDFPASLCHPRSAPETQTRKTHCVEANITAAAEIPNQAALTCSQCST